MACDLAEGGVALYAYEGFEGGLVVGRVQLHVAVEAYGCHARCIHIEDCLVRVLDFPYHHHAYHHGIAYFVVDLYRLDIDVVQPQRHFFSRHEGVYPIKTRGSERSPVFSEKYHYAGLIGLLDEEAA